MSNFVEGYKALICKIFEIKKSDAGAHGVDWGRFVFHNRKKLIQSLDALSNRHQKEVIKRHFGIGLSPHKLKEIAPYLNVTAQRVGIILKRALSKLRTDENLWPVAYLLHLSGYDTELLRKHATFHKVREELEGGQLTHDQFDQLNIADVWPTWSEGLQWALNEAKIFRVIDLITLSSRDMLQLSNFKDQFLEEIEKGYSEPRVVKYGLELGD